MFLVPQHLRRLGHCLVRGENNLRHPTELENAGMSKYLSGKYVFTRQSVDLNNLQPSWSKF